jgi:cytochrome c-type biogenesis protein CcmH/NrfF
MARVKKLEESLVSPCCYGEPVSRHMSEVAFQMRKEIAERVQAGQSNQEIVDHYKLLYGEWVLVEPDGREKVVLYSLPVLISIAGLGIVLLFLHHALERKSNSLETAGSEKRIDSKIAEAIRNATYDV